MARQGRGIDTLQRQQLFSIYHAALQSVHGRVRVGKALRCNATARHGMNGDVYVVAIGKAASAMFLGAVDVLQQQIASALVITKHGYADAEVTAKGARLIEAGHPTPDQPSLDAGQALLNFIHTSPADAELLFLISGGASSLVAGLKKFVPF